MAKNPAMTRKTLALYWQHVRQYRAKVTIVMILLPLAVFTERFGIRLIVADIFNRLQAGDYSDSLWQSFGPSLLLVVGLEFLAIGLWRLLVWFLWRFEVRTMRDIANRVFAHLMNHSYRFHINRFGGSLVSQSNKFIGSFERLFDSVVFEIGLTFWIVLFTVVVLYPLAPMYTLALVGFLVLYGSFVAWRMSKILPLNAAEAASETKRTGQLADSITNIMTAKSFGREDREQELFGKRAEDVEEASLRVMRKTLRNEIGFSSFNSTLNVAAISFGILVITRSEAPIGTLFLIISYTQELLRKMWEFQRIFKNLNRAFGDAQDMTEILTIEPEVLDSPAAVKFQPGRGDIIFHGVRFAYPEQQDRPLFKGLDLHIKPGEKVGLVGHSGGGKTTFTKLLLRFMDINEGQILIDGQDIAEVTQDSLRDAIAYVPQEPLMFHRSLSDNIRYGRLDAAEKEVSAAAKMAHADDFIQNLPKGYDTLVGERGTKLSGGQRQRVAIARAMLKNSPILLLDEATSALDSESEKLIQDALWKLMEGRTAIVIAHRLSTIQKMDRIIVMDEGEIVEQGSHRELLRTGGIYASLWSHQSGGFLED